MESGLRQVRVLINPKSGLRTSMEGLRRAFDRHWDVEGIDLSYQFTQSVEDGTSKARRAVDRGADTIIVVGGDGTVNTISRTLIGSDATLGIVPTGSGNGFARHFNIPLNAERAVAALARSEVKAIDVGLVDGRPFFVTCSMAWDASIVRAFEKMPIRGILPYVFAGVQEFFEYHPQPMVVETDDGETLDFEDPIIFTIANLTQFGGGAIIAPDATPDDGALELVVALRRDMPKLVANMARLFDGTINRMPGLVSRRFTALTVRRPQATPIQIDGELVEAPAEIKVSVQPGALKVLAPG